MIRRVFTAFAALLLMPGVATATLRDRGPVDRAPNSPYERVVSNVTPQVQGHGYPKWYRDTNGLPLQLCHTETLSKTATPADLALAKAFQPMMCLLAFPVQDNPDTQVVEDPNVLADPFGYPGNHGEEAFYMAVAPAMPDGTAGLVGNGISMGMDLALEAAYEVGPPVRGDEAVFGRIRIRIDLNRTDAANTALPPNPNLPAFGTYKVIHPYGVEVFAGVGEGGRAVNTTIDLGLVAQQFDLIVQGGRIGPFLTWDTFNLDPALSDEQLVFRDANGNVLEHYIGDPNVPHRVVGSVFRDDTDRLTNYVRIEGPAGCSIGGPGIDFIETDLFTISGKVWTKPIPAQLRVPRATYSRDATAAAVSVWATADVLPPNSANPQLVVSGAGMAATPMRHDGTGQFYGYFGFQPDAVLPASVLVTNATDGGPPVEAGVTDLVTAMAMYDVSTGLLDVCAVSSDQHPNGSPQLALLTSATTTTGTCTLAEMAGTAFSASLGLNVGAIVPPATVSVQSSAGGVGVAQVDVISSGGVPVVFPPVAVGDAYSTDENTMVALPITANDSATSPNTLAGIQILANPSHGSVRPSQADPLVLEYTPATNYFGPDSFTYAVRDSAGQLSNTATVTVDVAWVAIAPTANPDATNLRINASIPIEVLKNDLAANGFLDVGTVQITSAPALGTVSVNPLTGVVTYAAGAVGGLDAFTYTVSDSFGVASAPATVTVRVSADTDAVTVARAFYVVSKGAWRVEGSVSVIELPKTVTIYNGTSATAPLLATVDVLADGTFRWNSADRAPAPTATRTIFLRSSGGGELVFRNVLLK